jgi:hypothetical protein
MMEGTPHPTAPCKTDGCMNTKVRGRGIRYCEPCQESYEVGRKARRKPVKKCRDCGKVKPGGSGRQLCDDCARGNQLRKSRMRSYGLTMDEAIELESIKGCENCGSTHRLCVDHDHETGRVRGILCHGCNVALGAVKDNIKTLQGLITWLERR